MEDTPIANPYTSQSIASYNSSPPADDGSHTTANQVTWAKHKAKLADPIKTLAEAIDTSVNTAFATVDDASNLTTGELPDARLSSNVPRKNTANTFTDDQKIESAVPTQFFSETGVAADAGLWQVVVNSLTWNLQTRTDENGAGANPIKVTRSGTTVTDLDFTATSITANGSAVLTATTGVSLTGTQTVAGAKTFSAALVAADDFTVQDAFITNGVVSPAELDDAATVGPHDNYAPTGHAAASLFRLSADVGGASISGLAGGVAGRRITICNIGSNNISLLDESTESTAANRFRGAANRQIAAGGALDLIYDGTSNRWQIIGESTVSGQ